VRRVGVTDPQHMFGLHRFAIEITVDEVIPTTAGSRHAAARHYRQVVLALRVYLTSIWANGLYPTHRTSEPTHPQIAVQNGTLEETNNGNRRQDR
jgi:hypothetical protein